MTERKRITLEFYNQLNEPERSEAIVNFDENYTDYIPRDIYGSIMKGFNWCNSPQECTYWENIAFHLADNSYFTKPFSIEQLLLEMYPERSENSNIGLIYRIAREEGFNIYSKLKSLGKIKD